MKKWISVACVALIGVAAWAQRVEVRKSGSGKITINLSTFRTGGDASSKTFLAVLKADLLRSGYFKLAGSGSELGVSGKCVANASNIKVDCLLYKTGTRQRLLGKSFQAPTSGTRKLAHRVADAIILAATGKKGMASGQIALVGNHTGRKELYICDMDGKNLRQITKDRSLVVGPNWTPDAKRLVYTSYKHGYPNVYLTGRTRPISSYGGLNANAAISPDGSTMALILSKDGNPELYTKNLRTGKLRRLTRTQQGNEASPTWSPDGRQIAFVSDAGGSPQIYLISASGGRPRRLTTMGSESVAPEWGKNGTIVFSSRIGGRYRIVLANPTTRTVRQLPLDGADYEDPSWAPDGRHIVCSRTTNHRSSIYLLDTLEDSPVALLQGSSDWFSPACSP
jgi:TolB protein